MFNFSCSMPGWILVSTAPIIIMNFSFFWGGGGERVKKFFRLIVNSKFRSDEPNAIKLRRQLEEIKRRIQLQSTLMVYACFGFLVEYFFSIYNLFGNTHTHTQPKNETKKPNFYAIPGKLLNFVADFFSVKTSSAFDTCLFHKYFSLWLYPRGF